jgi:hypothetical protein
MDLRMSDLPVVFDFYDARRRRSHWYHRVREWWRRKFTSLHRGAR